MEKLYEIFEKVYNQGGYAKLKDPVTAAADNKIVKLVAVAMICEGEWEEPMENGRSVWHRNVLPYAIDENFHVWCIEDYFTEILDEFIKNL